MSNSATERNEANPSTGRVRVESYFMSVDGYGAGPDQSLEHPLGIGGEEMTEWVTATRSWRAMHGMDGGSTGVDDSFARRGTENLGAWIIGRNMFGPIRGPWPDDKWKGWWGDNPPYHVPVYVLTHHERPPLEMEGDTTFYFVTEGIQAALAMAREAADGKDVRIGGGAETIRQFLRARLIDEMHIAITPTILGSGEPLFAELDLRRSGYEVVQFEASDKALHVVIKRTEE
ncbi:MAG: dihydrofolate reductase [Bacteroidetes bacterium]|nr:dihydrofolate reductase [Bacteroidota bacterium]